MRISGIVSADGIPACALVLANGQHTFSCGGDGRYELRVPTDEQGRVTLFAFADGFAPYEALLSPIVAAIHDVILSVTDSERLPTAHYSLAPATSPGWVDLNGTLEWQGIPVCALVLANGQSMFSCEPSLGRFSLTVPIDQQGEITLFAFASGFVPYKIAIPALVSASGTVLASLGSDVDGDVNDPYAPYEANDTLALAQPIRNPSTLGGYVNQPFSGPAGPSYETGDSSDVFRGNFLAGQSLQLVLGDASAADLDLFLSDGQGFLVASSEGVGSSEQVIVPDDGQYFVEVFAYSSASTYVLTVGGSTAPVSEQNLSVLQDFVPGELLVKSSNDLSAARSGPGLLHKLQENGFTQVRGALHRLSMYRMHSSAGGVVRLTQRRQTSPIPVSFMHSVIDQDKVETIRMIKMLRKDRSVAYAEPNQLLSATREPNDPNFANQWHYRSIRLPQAWDTTVGASNVVVAVVDTGIVSRHPDIQDKLIGGYDFVSNPLRALDGNGIDPSPEDPGNDGFSGSSPFHGTHVAGTIGASSNNGIGVSGVAWGVSLMPLRALDANGLGTSYDVMQAVRYAAGLENDSGTTPTVPADIINLSLSGGAFSHAEQDTYTLINQKGTIIIAAAGNSGSSAPEYPAAYRGVVSVGAVTINENRAPYSNYGPSLDLVAPGGSMASDTDGDGYPDGVLSTAASRSFGQKIPNYVFMEGTSMASPHVAGVAALMKSVSPDLTYDGFIQLLSAGELTRDLGAPGKDQLFGWGVIDAYRSIAAVTNAPLDDLPRIHAVPAALNFGITETSLPLQIILDGHSDASITGVVVDDPWLSITQDQVDDRGSGSYTVTVIRTGLELGIYTSAVRVTTQSQTLAVPIVMEVAGLDIEADAGRQYVLLIDKRSGSILKQQAVDATDGRYDFLFEGVPIGVYEIVSGSDLNNNGLICDEVESCGAYPTLDNTQQTLSLTKNTSDLNFVTAFSPVIGQQQGSGTGMLGVTYERLRFDGGESDAAVATKRFHGLVK